MITRTTQRYARVIRLFFSLLQTDVKNRTHTTPSPSLNISSLFSFCNSFILTTYIRRKHVKYIHVTKAISSNKQFCRFLICTFVIFHLMDYRSSIEAIDEKTTHSRVNLSGSFYTKLYLIRWFVSHAPRGKEG